VANIGSARAPRIKVSVNGSDVTTVMHADIMYGGSCRSSHFDVTLAIEGQMADQNWLGAISGGVAVNIVAYSEWDATGASIFKGLADRISFDPIRAVARIAGTDYSSILANSSYQASFTNQTASDVVNLIATRHGFRTNITPTASLIGTYRNNNHNQTLLNAYSGITSEWDLLVHLANSEGFSFLIDGDMLVFAPPSDFDHPGKIVNKSQAKEMKFSKPCLLASRRSLVVKSWNSWLNQAFQYSTPMPSEDGIPDSIGIEDSTAPGISIIVPDLTSSGTEHLANRCLSTISTREFHAEIVMLADLSLKPMDVVTVTGTGTMFDKDYTVASLRRRFSPSAGFLDFFEGYASA